jgi:hypothetical protein
MTTIHPAPTAAALIGIPAVQSVVSRRTSEMDP